MTDFKQFFSDFSHLVSGMSSVAGGVKSEIEENVRCVFDNLAIQSGFVRRDEFDTLSQRLDATIEKIKELENKW